MSDWRFFDAFKRGDDAFKAELAAETDRSLARDPGRQPWGKRVEDVVDDQPTINRHSGEHRRARTGKGGQRERHDWSEDDWRAARRDYLDQNAAHLREQERREREEGRSLRELAAERRQAAREVREQLRDQERQARDDYRQGRPPPGYRGWAIVPVLAVTATGTTDPAAVPPADPSVIPLVGVGVVLVVLAVLILGGAGTLRRLRRQAEIAWRRWRWSR